MPKVCVIIPVYNRPQLIRDAIDSVLRQTFRDLELIVVNDGSTDNTEQAILSIDDQRIIYLKQTNKGAAIARNSGLYASSGEFIAFLDSDDVFLPDKIELQLKEVKKAPDIGLVFGMYYRTNALDMQQVISGVCYSELGLERLLLGPAFHWSTVLIRKSKLDEVGYFDEDLARGQDWELTLRLALSNCPMVCVPQKPLTIVRIQSVSNTRNAYQYEPILKKILNKTFRDPRMPPDLQYLKNTSHALQYVRIAGSAFIGSDFSLGHDMLEHALENDPSLKSENLNLMVNWLVNYISGLNIGTQEDILRQIKPYIPGEKSFVRKLDRKLHGRFYLEAAFQAYQLGQPANCRKSALKAIIYNPVNLRNRGLVAILLRSLLSRDSLTE